MTRLPGWPRGRGATAHCTAYVEASEVRLEVIPAALGAAAVAKVHAVLADVELVEVVPLPIRGLPAEGALLHAEVIRSSRPLHAVHVKVLLHSPLRHHRGIVRAHKSSPGQPRHPSAR